MSNRALLRREVRVCAQIAHQTLPPDFGEASDHADIGRRSPILGLVMLFGLSVLLTGISGLLGIGLAMLARWIGGQL